MPVFTTHCFFVSFSNPEQWCLAKIRYKRCSMTHTVLSLHPNVLHFVARWVFKFWSNLLRCVLIADKKSSKGRQQRVQKFEVPSLGDILQVTGARQKYTSVTTVRPSQGRDFIIVLFGDLIEETGQWVPWYESLMPIKNIKYCRNVQVSKKSSPNVSFSAFRLRSTWRKAPISH